MEISVDLIFDAAAIIAVVVSGITAWKTSARQNKQEKDILSMQHDHENATSRIQALEKRDTNYEDHRYTAITNYLKCVGGFLFADYSHEALSDFGKAVGEVFMYIPIDKYEAVKELNNIISKIATFRLGDNDDSSTRRDYLVEQAIPIFYSLCEDFSDLGIKKPSAIDNQQ